jgi:hypothetical protein
LLQAWAGRSFRGLFCTAPLGAGARPGQGSRGAHGHVVGLVTEGCLAQLPGGLRLSPAQRFGAVARLAPRPPSGGSGAHVLLGVGRAGGQRRGAGRYAQPCPEPVSKDRSMRVNMAGGHQARPLAAVVTARDRLRQATADNRQPIAHRACRFGRLHCGTSKRRPSAQNIWICAPWSADAVPLSRLRART